MTLRLTSSKHFLDPSGRKRIIGVHSTLSDFFILWEVSHHRHRHRHYDIIVLWGHLLTFIHWCLVKHGSQKLSTLLRSRVVEAREHVHHHHHHHHHMMVNVGFSFLSCQILCTVNDFTCCTLVTECFCTYQKYTDGVFTELALSLIHISLVEVSKQNRTSKQYFVLDRK